MSETRHITCPICGNTTDNSGNSLGTLELPDNTPEATWTAVMGSTICDRPFPCAVTHQQTMDQVKSVLTLNYRKTLLRDVFLALQTSMQSGKTLAQALADVLHLM